VENSKMILSVTKDIVNRYGCEVVNMGDYNMRPYDDAYKVMIGDGIVDETRFHSLRDGMIFRSGHAIGSSALIGGSPSRTIDFFFTTSKVNVLRTRIVINLQTSYCSDHWPIYIDFSLKK
jgi:endonuclease/exonuclease/phosphatase family metal-dependent hydrolase